MLSLLVHAIYQDIGCGGYNIISQLTEWLELLQGYRTLIARLFQKSSTHLPHTKPCPVGSWSEQ